MATTQVLGKCLCEAVTINTTLAQETFDACHCGMCRKWSGAPAMAVNGQDVKMSGEEFITVYSSSDWAERGFCKRCGTHLFYHLKGAGFYNFPMGLFKETEKFKFNMQIFIDHKPSCYEFANKTQTMTEAEVLAKYAPPPK